jgi:glycosyltransferase involved in cell wall biosynthesis
MKILMISDVYFPRINGVSTSIATFRKELVQLGHRICLIAPDYGTGNSADADEDIIRIHYRYLIVDPEDRMLKAHRILALLPHLREEAFDLIHIQTPFVAHWVGVELARRLNLPVIETCHTHFEEYLFHYIPFMPREAMRALARWFTRRQCNHVDAVVVPSLPMRDVLERYGIQKTVFIVPTGIDAEFMQGGSGERFRRAHGIAPDQPVLVHVGRVAHEKNIGFLLEMLVSVRKTVPDVLLIIAGEGPARSALMKKAADIGLKDSVRFVGYLTRGPDLWDCFCAGDTFVFASTTESQGLVLLEAMALGVPVVSTAVLGTKDILEPGVGVLVAKENVVDFSLQVVRLLSESGLRERLSAEARLYAKQWSSSRNAELLLELYSSVLRGKQPLMRNQTV